MFSPESLREDFLAAVQKIYNWGEDAGYLYTDCLIEFEETALTSDQMIDTAPNLTLTEDDLEEVLRGLAAGQVGSTLTVKDLGLGLVAYRLVELGYLDEAVATAKEIKDSEERVEVLVNILSHLTEEEQRRILHDELTLARANENRTYSTKAMAMLVQYLPETLREEVILEMLTNPRTAKIPSEGVKVLTLLAPSLAKLPREWFYPLWIATLHTLAASGRRALYSGLRALTPVIVAAGGEEAIVETFRAIQDVGRWWP